MTYFIFRRIAEPFCATHSNSLIPICYYDDTFYIGHSKLAIMPARLLTYMLILLFSYQAGFATADMHAAHQAGNQHLTFDDHQHKLQPGSKETGVKEGISATKSKPDCHHCCHCHGHLVQAILANPTAPFSYDIRMPAIGYFQHLPLRTLEPLYRPPIV